MTRGWKISPLASFGALLQLSRAAELLESTILNLGPCPVRSG